MVTREALEPFRSADHHYADELPDYLQSNLRNYDIKLEASVLRDGKLHTIAQSNLKHLHWTFEQMLADHSSNGCQMNSGDLLATGTISGPDSGSEGCLLESTEDGRVADPALGKGFLRDGDTVTLAGYCETGEIRLGFGKLSGQVVASSGDK